MFWPRSEPSNAWPDLDRIFLSFFNSIAEIIFENETATNAYKEIWNVYAFILTRKEPAKNASENVDLLQFAKTID